MPLINCKVELKLKWTKYCVLPATGNDNAINDDNNTNNITITIIVYVTNIIYYYILYIIIKLYSCSNPISKRQ